MKTDKLDTTPREKLGTKKQIKSLHLPAQNVQSVAPPRLAFSGSFHGLENCFLDKFGIYSTLPPNVHSMGSSERRNQAFQAQQLRKDTICKRSQGSCTTRRNSFQGLHTSATQDKLGMANPYRSWCAKFTKFVNELWILGIIFDLKCEYVGVDSRRGAFAFIVH